MHRHYILLAPYLQGLLLASLAFPSIGVGDAHRTRIKNAAILLSIDVPSIKNERSNRLELACATTIQIDWPPAEADTVYTQLISVTFGQDEDPEIGPCEEILYDYETFELFINGQNYTSSVPNVNENEAVGSSALLDQTLNIVRVTLDGIDVDGDPVTVEAFDTVYVNTTPKPIVSVAFNNVDNQNRALCAAACFSATQVASSVSYTSLDEPRSVTLIYDADRAHPRPFVYADVSLPSGANAPQEFWLQAKVKWGATFDDVTFANGETILKFSGSASVRRLAGQLDATDRSTGVYPLQIVVTSKYPTATVSHVVTTRLIVVNEGASYVAKGWIVAGLPRIISVGDTSALYIDGLGSAIYYDSRSCGASVCTYASPAGDFARLTDSASSINKVYTRVLPDSSRARFNYLGRALSVLNRHGHGSSFEYDGSQRLIKVFDALRRVNASSAKAYTRLFYDAVGIDSIVSPGPLGTESGGRVTRFTVSPSDSTLRVARDPDLDSTVYTYDGSKRLETIQDRRGNLTQLSYDSFWKLSSVTLPNVPIDIGSGNTQLTALTVGFRPWQVVGVPSGSTGSTPATPSFPDSAIGRIVSTAGDTTSFSVNKWGMPTKVIDPLNKATVFTYLATHPTLPISVARTGEGITKYGYDTNRGLVVSYQTPGQDSALRIAYGPYAQIDSTWGYLRPHVRYFRANSLGGFGRTDSIRVNFDANQVTKFVYDTLGRVTSTIEVGADTTYYHYDSTYGNLDSVRTSGGEWMKTVFDAFGRDSLVKSSSGSDGVLLYDAMNRLLQSYDSIGASPTLFEYDGMLLSRVKDPVGQVYKFSYNALGWLTKKFDPADTISRYEAYRYDAQGRLTSFTNRRGQRVDQSFDDLGRLLARSGDNVPTDSFSYSSDSRKVAYWNDVSRDSLFYSADGWLDSTVTRIAGRRFRIFNAPDPLLRLDSASVLSQLGGPSMSTRRAVWNPMSGTLDSVYVGTQVMGIGYDQKLRPDTMSSSVGNSGTRSYTSTDGIYHERVYLNGGATGLQVGYGRDSAGRLIQAYDSIAGSFSGRAFGYDKLGRLSTTSYFSLSSLCSATLLSGFVCAYSADSTRNYSYDAVGNDTTASELTAGNRLVEWHGIEYDYDLDGNRIRRCKVPVGSACSESDIRYEFSATNRLLKVIAGSDTTEYDYNPVGEVVRVSSNGVAIRHYLWENGHLLAELNGDGSQRVAQYVYGRGTDNPQAIISASAVRYLHQDAFGNVTAVYGGSGVHQHRSFDPWGSVTFASGSMADTNRLAWKSLIYEGDSTRLYYMRNRWFDPETGRFMSEDPIGLDGGVNLYAFGGSDPLNSWDPSGLSDCKFAYTGPNCPPGTILQTMTIVAGGSDPWGDFSGGGGAGGGAEGIAGSNDPNAIQDVDDAGSGDEDQKGDDAEQNNKAQKLACRMARIELALQFSVDALVLTGVGAGARTALAGRQVITKAMQKAAKKARKKLWRNQVRNLYRGLEAGRGMQARGIAEGVGEYGMAVAGNISTGPHESWFDVLPGFATWQAYKEMKAACNHD